MSSAHHAGAGGHRAGPDVVDAQHLEGGARPHHVDDGVEATQLVEVDLLGRTPVEPALDLGHGGEDGLGPIADPLGKAGLDDQARDVGVGAHDGGLVGSDVDLGGGHARPQHGLGFQLPSAHRQPPEQGPDLVEVGAGIDQAPEGHVAGDPGEAVEPGERATGHVSPGGDGSRRRRRRSRCRCRRR